MTQRTIDWLGIPFVSGGRDRATGMDCLGVVVAYMRAHGATIPDTPALHLRELAPEFLAAWEHIGNAGPFAPFDVLVVKGTWAFLHVGVVTPRGGVLTSNETYGSVCVPLAVFMRNGDILEAYKCRSL